MSSRRCALSSCCTGAGNCAFGPFGSLRGAAAAAAARLATASLATLAPAAAAAAAATAGALAAMAVAMQMGQTMLWGLDLCQEGQGGKELGWGREAARRYGLVRAVWRRRRPLELHARLRPCRRHPAVALDLPKAPAPSVLPRLGKEACEFLRRVQEAVLLLRERSTQVGGGGEERESAGACGDEELASAAAPWRASWASHRASALPNLLAIHRHCLNVLMSVACSTPL